MKQSGLGIASLVLGIIGILTSLLIIGIVPAVVGIILGIIALAQKEKAHSTAIAGVVCSIVAVVIFLVALFVFSDDDNTSDAGTTSIVTEAPASKKSTSKDNDVTSDNTADEAETKKEFEIGDTVETDGLRMQLLSAEPYSLDYDEPKNGNIFYQFEFEVENISDSDQYISSYDFNAYADGYDVETALSPDKKDLDASLSPGKKTKGIICFEVPEDAQKVTLEYETDAWTESKVCFVINRAE